MNKVTWTLEDKIQACEYQLAHKSPGIPTFIFYTSDNYFHWTDLKHWKARDEDTNFMYILFVMYSEGYLAEGEVYGS